MKTRFIFKFLFCGLLLILFGMTWAQGVDQKKIHRFALVVGNKAYTGKPWRPLKAPVKDAKDLSDVLRNAGFQIDSDSYIENGTGRDLRAAIDGFGTKVRQKRRDILRRNAQDSEGIVVVVFFSGHGFMVDEAAYLAGVDANGTYVEEIMQQSVKLNRLVQDLTPDERDVDLLSILLIDACRSQANLPSKAGSAGKSMMANSTNPFRQISGFGRISVFATTDGKVSFDGRNEGENSVFTAALLEAAQKPSSPKNFSDFVERVGTLTPKIAKQRFSIEQYPEIYKTGAAYDFYWGPGQAKDVQNNVLVLNSAKGVGDAGPSRLGWIWIGDYSKNGTGSWDVSRFAVTDSQVLPAPSELRAGREIQILANLNVRDRFPTRDSNCTKKYQECAALLGTIPKGLKVEIAEGPRASGQQNWVKVKFNAKAIY
ncbi:caspase family protein [Roseateles sp.]|uniref:caspase family protein n=1 Tax=Roseateles sp. TaxID=1971397 RepID=UPI0031E314F2